MNPARFLIALALLAAPLFVAGLDACEADRPLNRRDIRCDADQRDVVLLNQLDVYSEPTLRDEVRLNALDPYYEPTLRDEVRLNALDIYSEPTLRDTIVDETVTN